MVLAAATPLALRTPKGLALLESLVDGLPAGRLGRIEAQGLSGDPLGGFALRRLAIRDQKGVWIEVRVIRMNWNPLSLAGREILVSSATAEEVRVLRRPVLGPARPHLRLPVTVTISRLAANVESEPAFSTRRGAFRVSGELQLRRDDGGVSSRLGAESLLHAGDHLSLDIDLGPDRPLKVRLEALEAQGGALAGAAGVAPDKAFRLSVAADGKVDQGRLRADLNSGETQPVAIEGGWNPSGGNLTGQVDLSASTWTRPLAERLGRQLQLTGSARGEAVRRGAGRGRYEVDLTFIADAARATVRGPVDLEASQTGAAGLQVNLSAPSLSRILASEGLGAANLTGRLEGGVDAWRFAGDAEVRDLTVEGYTLARMGGPVSLKSNKGRLDLELEARGAGGRGGGAALGLLGAAPTLSVGAARLTDGALLVKDVRAAGAGFKVTGSGSRNLFGGLSFSGEAVVNRLGSILPGAGGGLSGRWSARSPRTAAAWTFTASARGEGLRTGRDEADRLLGLRPVLEAQAVLDRGDVRFEKLILQGQAFRASGRGGVLASGGVGLDFDWTASGPFIAGPVEIAGKASGDGRIGGRVLAPDVRMSADFDAISVPGLQLTQARLEMTASLSGGGAELRATSPYGPAVAGADFGFPRGGVQLSRIRVDAGGLRIGGEAMLTDRGPSRANLSLDLGRGAFLSRGAVAGTLKIEDKPGAGVWLDANLAARNALSAGETLSVSEGRFRVRGPLDRLALDLEARGQTLGGAWGIDGTGVANRSGDGWRVAFDGGGEAAGRHLRTLETAVFEVDGAQRRARLRLGLDKGGRADLDVAFSKAKAEVYGRIDALPADVIDPDLAGRLDAQFRIEGSGEHLTGSATGQLSEVRSRDADAALGVNGRFRASLGGEEVRLTADLGNAQGMSANGEVVLPVSTRVADFRIEPDRDRQLRGQVQANGEVKPLWDLFVGGEQSLSGVVSLNGALSGTLAAPRAEGQAEIENGAFADAASGLVLKNVIVRTRLSESAIRVDRASGADGQGGTISGSGVISLQEGVASSFRLDLLNFRVIDNELATAIASGQASVTRAVDGRVTLTGGLTINRADVTATAPTPTGVTPLSVTEVNRPVEVGLRPARESAGPAVALDVRLKAPQQVFIRGQGLELEMSVDARVSGSTSRPRLSGLARVVRGSYAFADKRFEIDPSGVVYLSENPARIRLDLAAVRNDPALTAIVRIRGTAARPEVTLTSTPPLPPDEIFSQILFGRSASQLSPVETAQLASAVAAMAGGGALDVIGNLRGLAGLDRLTFAGGSNGDGLEVSGGKYLTDNVLLIVTGGGWEGGSAQVEWNVSRSLSLISKLSGQGGNTLSVRWRRDY